MLFFKEEHLWTQAMGVSLPHEAAQMGQGPHCPSGGDGYMQNYIGCPPETQNLIPSLLVAA